MCVCARVWIASFFFLFLWLYDILSALCICAYTCVSSMFVGLRISFALQDLNKRNFLKKEQLEHKLKFIAFEVVPRKSVRENMSDKKVMHDMIYFSFFD